MSKISIDKDSYFEIIYFDETYCKLKVKYKKDSKTTAYVEFKLTVEDLDKFISEFASMRSILYSGKL